MVSFRNNQNLISGASGINAQMARQTWFFKELTCEIKGQWIFLCMLGSWCFSDTEIKKRLFINRKKVEMSGSGVIWIVRDTKRNDVNDEFTFTGVRESSRNSISRASPKLGWGRREFGSIQQIAQETVPFQCWLLPPILHNMENY